MFKENYKKVKLFFQNRRVRNFLIILGCAVLAHISLGLFRLLLFCAAGYCMYKKSWGTVLFCLFILLFAPYFAYYIAYTVPGFILALVSAYFTADIERHANLKAESARENVF